MAAHGEHGARPCATDRTCRVYDQLLTSPATGRSTPPGNYAGPAPRTPSDRGSRRNVRQARPGPGTHAASHSSPDPPLPACLETPFHPAPTRRGVRIGHGAAHKCQRCHSAHSKCRRHRVRRPAPLVDPHLSPSLPRPLFPFPLTIRMSMIRMNSFWLLHICTTCARSIVHVWQ